MWQSSAATDGMSYSACPPGDAPSASWTIGCDPVLVTSGFDLKGPYIPGRPGARFIYLSWGSVDDANEFRLFRRAKLWLDGVPAEVLTRAVARGLLVGLLGLTDRKGNPLCAAVRPPLITWTPGPANEGRSVGFPDKWINGRS